MKYKIFNIFKRKNSPSLDEAIFEACENAEESFNNFLKTDLEALTISQLTDISNKLGTLKVRFEYIGNVTSNPDYEQAKSRIDIMTKKIYQEAEKRDKENYEQ
ncbi:MAG: hypothetical protein ACP5OG_04115 [Candidatus Nanoarchaeia archaeon]